MQSHFDAVWIFPQKCAPSVGRNKPMTRSLKKTQKVKANAQGYSHLPTHLMVSIDRYENYLSKKVSLGTQIFIPCQIWQLEKQFYEKVNKFWLVSYEIEVAAPYEKSHSASSGHNSNNCPSSINKITSTSYFAADTECGEQHCYQMCDKSSFYMYFKNSVFPDFLLRLIRKSGFFFTITCPHASGLI